MTLRTRVISVKQVPEKLDVKQGKLFFRELESHMNVERPCIVLDCSHVREMDKSALHLLLCCLEGAIKRNGDVRLAAVAPAARLSLESAGLDRLFKVFETTDEAVESFQRHTTHGLTVASGSGVPRKSSANAA